MGIGREIEIEVETGTGVEIGRGKEIGREAGTGTETEAEAEMKTMKGTGIATMIGTKRNIEIKENIEGEKKIGVHKRVMEISTGPIQRKRHCGMIMMARKFPVTKYYFTMTSL